MDIVCHSAAGRLCRRVTRSLNQTPDDGPLCRSAEKALEEFRAALMVEELGIRGRDNSRSPGP
jgi:hypothetical protein